jgi:uncharacterized repeat protein (TIGR03803 family)
VLVAALGLMLAGQVTGQTFTVLHHFNGSDGGYPQADLILSGNTLYGTAAYSGTPGNGNVFRINTDGTGFTNLHIFGQTLGGPNFATNSDGAYPQAGLILSGNILYGTAAYGGTAGNGTVFSVNVDGTAFQTLYSFSETNGPYHTNYDGRVPAAALILSQSTLFGTASGGGNSGIGTVFRLNTDGTGFTNLHNFSGSLITNTDGGSPLAALILSNNTLYGTTSWGGTSGSGTVFRVNTDGSGFTTMHNFANNDGANPEAALILSGNTLVGTTKSGGSAGNGTLFTIRLDGTFFTTVHQFSRLYGLLIPPYGALSNHEGAYPNGVISLGNSYYGSAAEGGYWGSGSLFKITGDQVTAVYSFAAFDSPNPSTNNDGGSPVAGLLLSRNTLYGTTRFGGTSNYGTIFSFSLPSPQLTIIRYGVNVILTWPIDSAGFTLQSTTNLASPVWSTNAPAPVEVNGQYTVTNPISGTQQFFRLSQ